MKEDDKTKKQRGHELTELHSQNATLKKSTITGSISAELAVEEALRYAESIVETVREPLLVLDADLKIISANRNFYRTFEVTPGETIGCFIYDLGNKQWDIRKLRLLLEETLPEKEAFNDFEVDHNFQDIGHKSMLLNAREIYRKDISAKMILLAIEDITERKEIETGLEKTLQELEATKISEKAALEYAESIINTVREPLVALDQDLRVVKVSRSFYEFFKVNPEETMGQLIYDLGNKQWDIPKLRELLETILPQKATFDNYEVEHDFATIGRHTMLLNARQIQRVLGKERIILLAIEDITERKQAEEELKNAYKQVRSFAARLQEVREETRTRISHDVHDELGGALSRLKMDLLMLESIASGAEDRKQRQAMLDIIYGAKELINDTILATRRIIMEQRPSVLDDFGLAAAMEWQLGEFNTDTGMSFEFNAGQIEIDISKNLATIVFRIFQEALTNVIRHSKATEVYIGLRVDAGQLILEIKDNGRGIKEDELTGTGSIGIPSMREQALALGGEIKIAGESGKGTTLNLKIPI
jgi:PAS domain S-box-containing protein